MMEKELWCDGGAGKLQARWKALLWRWCDGGLLVAHGGGGGATVFDEEFDGGRAVAAGGRGC
ncbi:hypothetical protein DEO72_LG8g1743 [Vigna unguiculata]|uniref:Uncharacterized protein n=1 Tax=Vigna unguiculata TaxID=3917 RepID=A0A4D6MRM4_VIGUN|nr:hypothetical protein DEO72_LG8g1743 [Vigna unguiculata]